MRELNPWLGSVVLFSMFVFIGQFFEDIYLYNHLVAKIVFFFYIYLSIAWPKLVLTHLLCSGASRGCFSSAISVLVFPPQFFLTWGSFSSVVVLVHNPNLVFFLPRLWFGPSCVYLTYMWTSRRALNIHKVCLSTKQYCRSGKFTEP